MHKLTEIKELIEKHEKLTSRLSETRNPNKIDDTITRQTSIEERAFAYIPYLISLLEEKDKALAIYADVNNHELQYQATGFRKYMSVVDKDGGEVARTALNLNKEGKL